MVRARQLGCELPPRLRVAVVTLEPDARRPAPRRPGHHGRTDRRAPAGVNVLAGRRGSTLALVLGVEDTTATRSVVGTVLHGPASRRGRRRGGQRLRRAGRPICGPRTGRPGTRSRPRRPAPPLRASPTARGAVRRARPAAVPAGPQRPLRPAPLRPRRARARDRLRRRAPHRPRRHDRRLPRRRLQPDPRGEPASTCTPRPCGTGCGGSRSSPGATCPGSGTGSTPSSPSPSSVPGLWVRTSPSGSRSRAAPCRPGPPRRASTPSPGGPPRPTPRGSRAPGLRGRARRAPPGPPRRACPPAPRGAEPRSDPVEVRVGQPGDDLGLRPVHQLLAVQRHPPRLVVHHDVTIGSPCRTIVSNSWTWNPAPPSPIKQHDAAARLGPAGPRSPGPGCCRGGPCSRSPMARRGRACEHRHPDPSRADLAAVDDQRGVEGPARAATSCTHVERMQPTPDDGTGRPRTSEALRCTPVARSQFTRAVRRGRVVPSAAGGSAASVRVDVRGDADVEGADPAELGAVDVDLGSRWRPAVPSPRRDRPGRSPNRKPRPARPESGPLALGDQRAEPAGRPSR